MYLSFSSNIRRKNNNFSFVKLNTRLQSTGRNDLENLLNEKHNHGLQPSLPVSKLTTINTSSSKPFKLLPINFDIDADIFNIFLHQKSRQMFSISCKMDGNIGCCLSQPLPAQLVTSSSTVLQRGQTQMMITRCYRSLPPVHTGAVRQVTPIPTFHGLHS